MSTFEVQLDDPAALNAAGRNALSRGDGITAREMLARANAADPGQPALLFNLSAAHKMCGDVAAALATLQAALEADPYFVQAMFQMAVLYEDNGDARSAASVYRNFLATAPEEVRNDPRFAGPIAHAQAVVSADDQLLGKRLNQEIEDASTRVGEAIGALLGRNRIYVSEPTFLTVPRLPAIPFFDRGLTPWLSELEALAPAIAEDARTAMGAAGGFVPYVANPAGTPLNQWRELNHSADWGAFFFWKHGVRSDENCSLYAATALALDKVPLLKLEGRGPNAFFSRLRPKTKIPPHTGVTNARVTVHLPLIVPNGCGFRVGAETRRWEAGKAWVFDDTIEHEAWNNSEQDRIILIFDIWHPMLDTDERGALAKTLAAYDSHYGTREGLTDTL